MKEVILLRHAKSSWDNPNLDDHERPLSKRGIHDAPSIGKYLKFKNIIPDLVLCSTAVRTKMTLDLVLDELDENIKIIYDSKIYSSDADCIIKMISKISDNVKIIMIVGHNPDMEDLVQIMLDDSLPFKKFSTSAVAHIVFNIDSWQNILNNTGCLKRFKTPRMLQK